MEKERMMFFVKEGAIALALAVICIAAAMHGQPTTLDYKAYDTALKLSQNALDKPYLAAHGFAYGIAKSFLSGAGSETSKIIAYFISVPPILLFLLAAMTYATLRMWKFGKIESASAVMLVSLGALSPIYYPGNFPPIAFGLVLAAAGMMLTSVSIYLKENAPLSIFSSLVAAVLLALAVWISPETVWIPAAVLIAEVAHQWKKIGAIVSNPQAAARMAALVIAIVAAGAFGTLGAIKWQFSSMADLLLFAPFATGFAALTLLFLYWENGHERAPEFALLGILAFFAAGTSAGVGAIVLSIPCAYGIRSFTGWKGYAPLLRALLPAFPVLFAVIGIWGTGGNVAQAFAAGVLAAGAMFFAVFLFDWEGGNFARFGLLLFLCASSVMLAIQAKPFRASAMAELKDYQPIQPEMQKALVWIGNSASGNGKVAAFAPKMAVKFLSGRDAAFENEEEFAKWLASKSGETPLPAGTLAVLEPSAFASMDRLLANSSKGWSLAAFGFTQMTTDSNGRSYGIYMASDGTRIAAQLDSEGNMLPQQVRLIDYYGRDAGGIAIGQIVPLVPGMRSNTTNSILVMPNREYGTTLLAAYSDAGAYPRIYENATTIVVGAGRGQ